MALIKPEIQEILRKAGMGAASGRSESGSVESSEAPPRTLIEKLNAAGLSMEETLEELATIAKGSMNESLRARCLETVLKAHGALKDSNTTPIPSFTIMINSSLESPTHSSGVEGVEKDLLAAGQNPILYPRQLLKSDNLKTN